MGNSSSYPESTIGNPSPSIVNSKGYIDRDKYMTSTGAQADKFKLLPKPTDNPNDIDGFQAGHFAYLVEGYFKAPVWGSGGQGDKKGGTNASYHYTRVLF